MNRDMLGAAIKSLSIAIIWGDVAINRWTEIKLKIVIKIGSVKLKC